MDVGDPSNFARLQRLLGSTWNMVSNKLQAFTFNDNQTIQALKDMFNQYAYVSDPHTAIAYLAASEISEENKICLATAHFAKFLPTVEEALHKSLTIPVELSSLKHKSSNYTTLDNSFNTFKSWLLSSV